MVTSVINRLRAKTTEASQKALIKTLVRINHGIADRFLNSFEHEMLINFRTYLQVCATNVKAGLEPINNDQLMDFLQKHYRIKSRYIIEIVNQVYNELSGMKDIIQGSGSEKAKAMDLSIVQQVVYEEENLINEIELKNVDKYLIETSKREARTYANKIQNIYDEAGSYVDPETGRGLTVRDISNQMLSAGIAPTQHYSNLIARTATMWASNEASLISYKELSVPILVWYATDDDLTCEFCLTMHGQKISTGNTFLEQDMKFAVEGLNAQGDSVIKTLDIPYDIHHPPLHVFCRCILVPDYDGTFVPEPIESRFNKVGIPTRPAR